MFDDESRLVHSITITNTIPRSLKNELSERMKMKVFLYTFKNDMEIDLVNIIIEEMIDASTKTVSQSSLPFVRLVIEILTVAGYKLFRNEPEDKKMERLDARYGEHASDLDNECGGGEDQAGRYRYTAGCNGDRGLLWSSLRGKHNGSRRLPPGPMGLPVIVPAVLVSSPQAAELFLKTHEDVFASHPNAQAAECLSYGNKGLAFSHYGPYWLNIRKICTLEFLTNLKVEYFIPMRKGEVSNLVRSLRVTAKVQTVVNLGFMVQSVIEDMTFRMLFGGKDDRFYFKPLIQETIRLGRNVQCG
ncbi:hypothetical protein GIB67_020844 [Kingdonia uniflora]|uniref:Uncharacterized protein n=1 Tax=Kingdonia uniflora TaxID=39325 RepID=A0A7J7M795_9MAGN|nr:hypothetical protein GIB67_020844 [Kingdonia uniflora]